MAMVLLGVPRGQNFVAEGVGKKSLLSLVGSGSHDNAVGPKTLTATFDEFDLSEFPAISTYSPAATETFWGAVCAYGNPSTGGECSLASDVGDLAVCSHVGSPPCVGCWAGDAPPRLGVGALSATADLRPLSLDLLFRSSVALPSSVGSSASWSPGVEVAHCDTCAVTLVAPAGSPVTVSGTYDDGWTITRSASGEAVLDLKVGDFNVGEVTVTEAGGTPDAPDSTPDGGGDGPVWGTADFTVFDTFPQFVNEAGRTSRVLESGALDDRGVLWLKETSDNTSAWYGLDLSTGAFELDGQTAFCVQWLGPNDAGYAEVYAQLDDAQKSKIENGWIFLIGVEDLAGNTIQPAHPVNVYVQIGDDWDADDLHAYYIAAGGDENVPVDYLMLDSPGGTDTFGRMTLEHFSPYIIFDELTDEEQATLGKGNPTTGDHAAQMAISGLGMVLVLALGIMLRLITSKRKFDE